MKIPLDRLRLLARNAADRLAGLAGDALTREVETIMRQTETEHELHRRARAGKRERR